MPRHNRYGWLPDEELGALLQRNPDMLKPIEPQPAAVVMPAVPAPTTRRGRIKAAAVAIFTQRRSNP